MPKYQKREFQIGEYWLSKKDGQGAWCKTWFDSRSRQTRRVSLGSDSLEEAKQTLAEWYAAQFQAPSEDQPPSAVKLAAVILDYWNGQGSKLRSAETVKIHLRYWQEFWGDVSVGDVRSPIRQEEFRTWLFKRGYAHNSVNRCLEAGRAAIRRSWKRGVISSAPFIQMLPSVENAPMGRPLSRDEAGALYQAATQDHMRLYTIIGLATGARPEAITDLTWDRIDWEKGLIQLNPIGRAQNKKHRPTVRIGPTTLKLLKDAHAKKQGEHVIMFRNRHVHRLDTAWSKAVTGAGLDKRVTLYSLRHTVASYLRGQGVDAWQVASLLGHKREGLGITERYTKYDPSFQQEAATALDKLILFCVSACGLRADANQSKPLSPSSSLEENHVQTDTWFSKSG